MEIKNVTPQISQIATQYQYHDPPGFLVSLQDFILHVMRVISDFLGSFKIVIPGLSDTSTVSSIMQFLLYSAGVAGAAAVMWVLWTRLGYLNDQSRLARGGKAIVQTLLDSSGWKSEADKFAAAGEWKDACRAVYLSLLRLFAESKITEFSPTRTNYEYYYVLAGHPNIQSGFRQLAEKVESIWFGGAQAEQADYDFCRQKVEELSTEINARGAA
jgi:hypothetical protein